jgi:hypothetical protein
MACPEMDRPLNRGQIRKLATAVALSPLLAMPAGAEPVARPDGRVLTEDAGEHSDLVCRLASRVTEQLATRSLTVPAPVTIAVAPELRDQRLGLYHCGQGRVEILAPGAYAALRADGQAPAFAPVSDEAFFESVIRHELVHAALDDMPCPFDSCPTGQEYVAYTMQIRFLPEADRTAFEDATEHEGRVSRDMLSRIMLMMAPDLFAQRAWLHLKQRDDPCGFIGQIARGEVLLDYEHP